MSKTTGKRKRRDKKGKESWSNEEWIEYLALCVHSRQHENFARRAEIETLRRKQNANPGRVGAGNGLLRYAPGGNG
jgi:hypothetical protein